MKKNIIPLLIIILVAIGISIESTPENKELVVQYINKLMSIDLTSPEFIIFVFCAPLFILIIHDAFLAKEV
jgi:hypothetical protein